MVLKTIELFFCLSMTAKVFQVIKQLVDVFCRPLVTTLVFWNIKEANPMV